MRVLREIASGSSSQSWRRRQKMPSRRSHFTRAHSQEATSTHLSLKKQSNTTPRSFPFLHIVRLIVRALIWMWFLRNGMKFSARAAYATIAPAKSLLRGKKGPPLTLEHVGTLSNIAKGLGAPILTVYCCSSCNEAKCWRCGEMLYALSTVCAMSRFLGRSELPRPNMNG